MTRPRCRGCDKPLPAEYAIEWVSSEVVDFKGDTKLRTDPVKADKPPKYGYQGNGFFCTLRCGYRFGVRVASAADD